MQKMLAGSMPLGAHFGAPSPIPYLWLFAGLFARCPLASACGLVMGQNIFVRTASLIPCPHSDHSMSLPDPQALLRSLDQYTVVVERQSSSRLPELDRWYREELPGLIAGRDRPHITLPELVRLTEWKMARGVWRAPNLVRVRGNDPEVVKATSTAALAEIPDPRGPVARLAELDGVGPATASAAVAAAAPHLYPFFDELVAAQLPEMGPMRWDVGSYLRYAEAVRKAARELGGAWTPVRLERALWAHVGGKAGEAGSAGTGD